MCHQVSEGRLGWSAGGVAPSVPACGLLLLNQKMIWSERCKTLKGKFFLQETAPGSHHSSHHSRPSACPVSEAVWVLHILPFPSRNASDLAQCSPYSTDGKTELPKHLLHVEGDDLNGTVSNVMLAESALSYRQTAGFEMRWRLACWHPTTHQCCINKVNRLTFECDLIFPPLPRGR